MPGIVGFTASVSGEENWKTVLSEMQHLVTHFDSYVRSALFSDSHVSVCHSDKHIGSRGLQPFHEQGVYVWLDGELFKVEESAKTARPIEGAATEVLCRLFLEDRGLSFLRRLDGIYSAVIYDSKNSKVHLITDRYGLRHLYWTSRHGGLAWGSELKAMLALPDFRPEIDRIALGHFVREGFVPDNRTWFEGVTLLAPGTVLSWDLRQNTICTTKYWGWESIRQISGKIDEIEIADELARLLVRATEIRCRQGERIGTLLSGGLDSRVILAAMPVRDQPLNCVTFGKRDCVDLSIARRAADVKGAVHHFLEINGENFLRGRSAGVWWIDGQSNLMDLHVTAMLPKDREWFDIVFDGFWGDATIGGCYIQPTGADEIEMLSNRGRRFIINGPRFLGTWLECRLPFCDNDLVDLAMSIPREIRATFQLYTKMLWRNFHAYYERIPWQRTALPIGYPTFPAQGKLWGRKWLLRWGLMAIWGRLRWALESPNYVDYDSWIRQEPARSFIQSFLKSKSALYPEFVPREEVILLWNRHLNGYDGARQLFAYLTLELWLQQVFEGKYRPAADTPDNVWTM